MMFPIVRGRRLRQKGIRDMIRENYLRKEDLIYPFFVTEGKDIKQEISSMPGNYRWSVDRLEEIISDISTAGVPSIMLFGIPASKDGKASQAYAEDGIVQKAIRRIKELNKDIVVITDVCLCEYTDHGHCGMVDGEEILNDPSLELLAQTALSHAQAGADMVAPSDMMDGRVLAIRNKLDGNMLSNIPIMSYAVKYASAYYGPFRDAADSAPKFGDRKTYQMDPANSREAMREAEEDIAEGADIIMVKPGMPYLDILSKVSERTDVPLAVYQVSGEYAMIKAASINGWVDEKRIVLETLLGFKRAGADLILSYYAKEAAAWLG